jgi:hypothetical protein
MDIERLKQERARHQRRPWPRSLFTRISSIVKAYGLGADFLRALDSLPESLTEDRLLFNKVKAKEPLPLPLFALATEEEYQLITTIISKINNPYLHHVQDPEEIMLSRLLFLRNPHLGPEDLSRWHFTTVLRQELAGKGPAPGIET